MVAEKYLLTEENSIEINGQKYLSPDYDVHHIDFNRLNNDKNNLYVLKKKSILDFIIVWIIILEMKKVVFLI